MKTVTTRLTSLALALPLSLLSLNIHAVPPPPGYVELTRQEMRRLGFEYQVRKEKNVSFIELRYPEQITESRKPHSARIVVRDLKGALISDSTQWLGACQTNRIVESRYDHGKVDVSISVTFSIGSNQATAFGIQSVSRFVQEDTASNARH